MRCSLDRCRPCMLGLTILLAGCASTQGAGGPAAGAVTLLGYTPNVILEALQSLAILAGGIWALVSFRNSNRIKSIETLITLEEEYRKHLPILLEIECDYAEKIKPLLDEEKNNALSTANREKINTLDEALRHFAICAQTRNLGVDRGLLDVTYQYYLGMIYSAARPELKAYIDTYWSTIAAWARACGSPRSFWRRLIRLD